jgi:hypothetical protein
MTEGKHRLRDSLPIRFGIGLIGLVVLLFVWVWISSSYPHSEIGAVGPIGTTLSAERRLTFALAAILLALGLIFVGIGQTIVRRRRTGNCK